MDKVNIGVEASSWINVVAGLAIAGVAWYETAEYDNAFYSGIVSGLLLVLAGAWTAYDAARNSARNSTWVSAASIAVGVWIFAFPWFVTLTDLYFWTSLVVGAAVVLVSAFEVYSAVTSDTTRPSRPVV